MAILIFFVSHWYTSLFSQTFFHHRYAAHKMFTMNKFWEKVFYLFSYISQGSSYLSPYAYGIMHRQHHAHADTEHDPHSPSNSPNLFSMMWETKNNYNDILKEKVAIDDRLRIGLPKWNLVEKIGNAWASRIVWIILYTIFYVFFATSWWMYLLLPIHFVMGPFHGAIINWFAHKYGYTNFETKDTSKNFLPFDFLMLGESYHNNHHKFKGRPNFGFRWFEFDPVYPIILLFNKLGIIHLKKVPA
ncbi:MAG: acyl-CoA desaturase [Bacteroidota bacterium]